MRAALILGLAALSLAACGRVGPVKPIGPASEVTYPRTYPKPDPSVMLRPAPAASNGAVIPSQAGPATSSSVTNPFGLNSGGIDSTMNNTPAATSGPATAP